MAIVWGGFAGHMRVGIDVWTDSYNTNTPSINVYVDVYVQIDSTWNFADNQHISLSGNAGAEWDFYNGLQQNQSLFIGRATVPNQVQSYSGGPTYYFKAVLSGHYQGASPWMETWFTLPARPANVPTAPVAGVSNVASTSVKLNLLQGSDPRGSTIDAYYFQVSTNSSFSSLIYNQANPGSPTITGLSPSTTYYFRIIAHNAVGNSSASNTVAFTTGATAPGVPGSFTIDQIAQTSARATFTAPGNGGSTITKYEVQLATNSTFTTGILTYSGGGSPINLTDLVPGIQYYARARAINSVGAGSYTATQNFTTLAGTPTIIDPANNSTKGDSLAKVTLSALGIASDRTITVQLSKSSTFASGITTLTLNPQGASSNNQYTLSDPTKYLDNGTWYVRARVTNNTTGYITPWSSTVTFTQSHVPSASVVTPTAGQTWGYQAEVSFSFRFVDAAGSNDWMTAYQLVIENNSTGAVIFDSDKVAATTTPSNPVAVVNVPLASSLKNTLLRWRVRVWDRGDTAGTYTGYALFTLADLPVVDITSPASGTPVDNGAPTVSWNVSIPSGGTQTQAVVKIFDATDASLVWQTTVQGQTTSVAPAVVVLRNGVDYYVTVDVTDSKGLVGTDQNSFSTLYQAPSSILYTIAADDVDERGYVLIDWSNANPDDLFTSWKVYRRSQTNQTWELLTTITSINTRQYRDYMLNAAETYTYSVTQVAVRSGSLLESSVGYYASPTDGSTTVEDRFYFMDLTYYWIINPDDTTLSLKLENVTNAPMKLEFESATYTIIGRGRHRDYGDELGYSGSITCQAKIPERPSTFRKAVEALRRAQETYYLRTPFGQLFPVAMGDIEWDPEAGVGTAEQGELSFDYEEVH